MLCYTWPITLNHTNIVKFSVFLFAVSKINAPFVLTENLFSRKYFLVPSSPLQFFRPPPSLPCHHHLYLLCDNHHCSPLCHHHCHHTYDATIATTIPLCNINDFPCVPKQHKKFSGSFSRKQVIFWANVFPLKTFSQGNNFTPKQSERKYLTLKPPKHLYSPEYLHD